MTGGQPGNLRRPAGGTARVTQVELFFDLVYVFAVTQLSRYLIDHPTVGGALRALLLLTIHPGRGHRRPPDRAHWPAGAPLRHPPFCLPVSNWSLLCQTRTRNPGKLVDTTIHLRGE